MSQLSGNTWLTVVWVGYCHAQCTKLCTVTELQPGLTFNGKGMASGSSGQQILLYMQFLSPLRWCPRSLLPLHQQKL